VTTQPPIQWALFLQVKATGAWSWQLTSISFRSQEWVELYIHSPNTPSWRGSQLKHRDKFTFYLYFYHSMTICLFNYFIMSEVLKNRFWDSLSSNVN
jgi:hypothetical protein